LSNPISNSRKSPIYMNEDKSTLQTYLDFRSLMYNINIEPDKDKESDAKKDGEVVLNGCYQICENSKNETKISQSPASSDGGLAKHRRPVRLRFNIVIQASQTVPFGGISSGTLKDSNSMFGTKIG